MRGVGPFRRRPYFASLFGPGRRGAAALIISRPCVQSKRRNARSRRRFRHQPGGAAVSHRLPWTMTRHRTPDRYLGSLLGRRGGVGATAATSPSRAGREWSAVLRRLGKVQLPGWDVPGLGQPAGPGPLDKRLYLPESWLGRGPVCGPGVPEERRGYRSKTRAGDTGGNPCTRASRPVAGDDAFGMAVLP